MGAETKIDALIDANVFEPSRDGEGYEITDAFRASVEARHDELADLAPSGIRENIRDIFGEGEIATLVGDVSETDREFAAVCVTLADRLDSADEIVRLAPIVQQYRRGVPRDDGVPEPFLAVHGDRLATFTRLYQQSVVYVWREDCPPCDMMRTTLTELFATDSDGPALFAVYGPDYARTLADAFDVVGGPTTLFVYEGRVESRLQGAHHPESIENEVEILLER